MPKGNFEVDRTTKVQQWFKDNISILTIFLIALLYVFYGIVTIDKTGKTIQEIIVDGVLSFVMGLLIKTLLSNQGLSNGERCKTFLETKAYYSSVLDEISPYSQYLSAFCDKENAETLRKGQADILTSNALKYKDLENDTFNYEKLTKKQIRAIKRARNFKINRISETILLSDLESNVSHGEKLDINKRSYSRENITTTVITMCATAIIFGYYGIDPNKGFNWNGAIWNLVQMAIYIGFGVTQYFKGYTFMTDKYRNILKRKSTLLEKFKNMYAENPNQFREEPIENNKTSILSLSQAIENKSKEKENGNGDNKENPTTGFTSTTTI